VLTLRSEDNPADPLTRNKPLCATRNKKFQRIVDSYWSGQHITEFPCANAARKHEEKEVGSHYDSDEEANTEDPEESFVMLTDEADEE